MTNPKQLIRALTDAAFARGGNEARQRVSLDQVTKQAKAEQDLLDQLERVPEMIQCIRMLRATLDDIGPQMRSIVLQDYAQYNEGLVLANKLLAKTQEPG